MGSGGPVQHSLLVYLIGICIFKALHVFNRYNFYDELIKLVSFKAVWRGAILSAVYTS